MRWGDFHVEAAFKNATAMLAMDDRPTAIFAGSDLQAMGVLEAARLARVPVPAQLSLVGFDDIPLSRWMSPPLTSVRQPLAEMAGTAVRLVLSRDGTSKEDRSVELATTLVVRESTAAPPEPSGRLHERPGCVRSHPGHQGNRAQTASPFVCEVLHRRVAQHGELHYRVTPPTSRSCALAYWRCLGQERYELFFESLLTNFFGDADAAFLASIGVNSVRIPLNYRHLEDDADPFVVKEEGFRHLDRAIAACAA